MDFLSQFKLRVGEVHDISQQHNLHGIRFLRIWHLGLKCDYFHNRESLGRRRHFKGGRGVQSHLPPFAGFFFPYFNQQQLPVPRCLTLENGADVFPD